MDEEQHTEGDGGGEDLGLGAKVAAAGVATPAELKAIVAGTSLGAHFDETAEDYFVANASHKAAAERVNPAMSKLLARLGPLANRVEVLGMNRKNRERARTFLGGDLTTDDRDQEAIQRLKDRLGIDRIREKYRTTTKMLASYTGQHHLLLASEHIGDALRYAEHEQFGTIEFSYNSIDGDRWAKVINECVVGEFTGIYAAAILWQGIAAERAKSSRELRLQRQSRRDTLAGISTSPAGLVPLTTIMTTDAAEAEDEADDTTKGSTIGIGVNLGDTNADDVDANDAANDTVEPAMAARSPVALDTVIDSLSDEALTMMLLRRHNPTIGDGRYAILDITVADGQVTFKGRLV